MNPAAIRLLKEARVLFWPWCGVTIIGALPILPRAYAHIFGFNFYYVLYDIGALSVFLGVPLLTALSLGAEFRHGTLSLLLSQPASRMSIWNEKMGVTVVAVLSAALVQAYAWRGVLREDPRVSVLAVIALSALVGSTVYWTLVARSPMGAFYLNPLVQWMVVGGGALLVAWALGPKPSSSDTWIALSAGAVVAFCYVGLMLWLGRRKLSQFQMTRGILASEFLMTGRVGLPEALTGWLRCSPTEGTLNLVRKELRLQQPTWLVAPVLLLGYLALAGCALILPNPEPSSRVFQGFKLILEFDYRMRHLWQSPVNVMGFVAGMIVALGGTLVPILAGSLSVGEEKSWGTQSWHLTLPVAAFRQWLVKLGVSIFTSLFCAVLLPAAALAGMSFIFGPPSLFSGEISTALIMASLYTLATFWCACAVSGTSRAAYWAIPALLPVYLAAVWGISIGHATMPASGTIRSLAVATLHLRPYALSLAPDSVAACWLAPTFLLAIVQSYRMFRVQANDGDRKIILRLVWLAVVAFVCSFSITASGFSQ